MQIVKVALIYIYTDGKKVNSLTYFITLQTSLVIRNVDTHLRRLHSVLVIFEVILGRIRGQILRQVSSNSVGLNLYKTTIRIL